MEPVINMRRFLICVVVVFLAGAVRVEAGSDADGFGGAEVVPVEELESTRGGYKTGTDLMFSFGIEKAVFVNGVLEATSIIQRGEPGNPNVGKNFSSISPDSFRGIIVQNSLNDTKLLTITKISVGLDVLGAFREKNLSTILNQQLFRTLR